MHVAGLGAMSEKRGKSLASAVILGLLFVAMGAFVVLAVTGIIPEGQKGLGAPVWVAVCAGGLFVLAGGAVLLRTAAGGNLDDGEMPANAPFWMRLAQYFIGLAIVAGLASIGSWVAFAPGEREFTVTSTLTGRAPANEWIGRIVFGIGAVIVWAMLVVFAVSWKRKLFGRNARV
jgi:hypothetical protein